MNKKMKIQKEKEAAAKLEKKFSRLFEKWKKEGLSEREIDKKILGFKWNN